MKKLFTPVTGMTATWVIGGSALIALATVLFYGTNPMLAQVGENEGYDPLQCHFCSLNCNQQFQQSAALCDDPPGCSGLQCGSCYTQAVCAGHQCHLACDACFRTEADRQRQQQITDYYCSDDYQLPSGGGNSGGSDNGGDNGGNENGEGCVARDLPNGQPDDHECNDGNSKDGDGCSSECKIESVGELTSCPCGGEKFRHPNGSSCADHNTSDVCLMVNLSNRFDDMYGWYCNDAISIAIRDFTAACDTGSSGNSGGSDNGGDNGDNGNPPPTCNPTECQANSTCDGYDEWAQTCSPSQIFNCSEYRCVGAQCVGSSRYRLCPQSGTSGGDDGGSFSGSNGGNTGFDCINGKCVYGGSQYPNAAVCTEACGGWNPPNICLDCQSRNCPAPYVCYASTTRGKPAVCARPGASAADWTECSGSPKPPSEPPQRPEPPSNPNPPTCFQNCRDAILNIRPGTPELAVNTYCAERCGGTDGGESGGVFGDPPPVYRCTENNCNRKECSACGGTYRYCTEYACSDNSCRANNQPADSCLFELDKCFDSAKCVEQCKTEVAKVTNVTDPYLETGCETACTDVITDSINGDEKVMHGKSASVYTHALRYCSKHTFVCFNVESIQRPSNVDPTSVFTVKTVSCDSEECNLGRCGEEPPNRPGGNSGGTDGGSIGGVFGDPPPVNQRCYYSACRNIPIPNQECKAPDIQVSCDDPRCNVGPCDNPRPPPPSSPGPDEPNCALMVCPDGEVFPRCTDDGHPINYFRDPCGPVNPPPPPPPPPPASSCVEQCEEQVLQLKPGVDPQAVKNYCDDLCDDTPEPPQKPEPEPPSKPQQEPEPPVEQEPPEACPFGKQDCPTQCRALLEGSRSWPSSEYQTLYDNAFCIQACKATSPNISLDKYTWFPVSTYHADQYWRTLTAACNNIVQNDQEYSYNYRRNDVPRPMNACFSNENCYRECINATSPSYHDDIRLNVCEYLCMQPRVAEEQFMRPEEMEQYETLINHCSNLTGTCIENVKCVTQIINGNAKGKCTYNICGEGPQEPLSCTNQPDFTNAASNPEKCQRCLDVSCPLTGGSPAVSRALCTLFCN